MTNHFLTFQKFNDAGLANAIGEKLQQNEIPFQIEDNQKLFDPSYANNTINHDIHLKVKSEDFTKAHKALEEYYKSLIDTVDKDYYLF
ncbi:MAG: hypothetical protein JWQ09_4006 [Segetibacter sp.]|nr:hypothetical protein [Segetibacter sp.]